MRVKDLYLSEVYISPDETEDSVYLLGDLCSYDPILNDLGKVLFKLDEGSYSGDTRLIYTDSNSRYGILTFGWGSCSGCDALQSCEDWKEVQDLYNHLESSIKWFDSKQELIDYLCDHDWEGDYDYSLKFILGAIKYLVTN